MKREISSNLSGYEDYYRNSLTLSVENILCNKVHHRKGSNFIHFSYKTSELRMETAKVSQVETPKDKSLCGQESSSSLLLSSIELSDTKVYEPLLRALLGTASQFCEVVVPKSRTVPSEEGLS